MTFNTANQSSPPRPPGPRSLPRQSVAKAGSPLSLGPRSLWAFAILLSCTSCSIFKADAPDSTIVYISDCWKLFCPPEQIVPEEFAGADIVVSVDELRRLVPPQDSSTSGTLFEVKPKRFYKAPTRAELTSQRALIVFDDMPFDLDNVMHRRPAACHVLLLFLQHDGGGEGIETPTGFRALWLDLPALRVAESLSWKEYGITGTDDTPTKETPPNQPSP